MKLYLIYIFLFFTSIASYSQEFEESKLVTMEDEELLALYDKVKKDTIEAEKVVRIYLERARIQKDTIKMARGYDRLARLFNPKKNIQFADSIIDFTQHIENITYPALGYMIKAFEYNRLNNLPESTKNLYLVYDYASKNENIIHQLHALELLITSKSFWGNQQQALELQKYRDGLLSDPDIFYKIKKTSRKDYQKKTSYLIEESKALSFMSFILCYTNLGEYEKAQEYIYLTKTFLSKHRNNHLNDYSTWLLVCEMEISFYQKKYFEVFKIEKKLLSLPEYSGSYGMFDLNNFVGLSYINLNEYEKGIFYLKKADSIYVNTNKMLLPYQRRVFEELLNYYKIKNDTANQLEIYNKLMKIDSVFKENFKFFEPDMIKKFETPRLLKEKEKMIAGLEEKNKKSLTYTWGALILSLIAISGLLYYFIRQRVYKRRFENLIAKKNLPENSNSESHNDISVKVVEDILKHLESFERNKEYLSSKISLNSLSKNFNTNSNYLSKIINLRMGKNFSQYINDLRVKFALDELKRNTKFRKYTIKAIAQECGFNSAESFTRAFYKQHKIYPSYYIKKLEEEKLK